MPYNNEVNTPYFTLYPDSGTMDAFARSRFSQPTTLFDSKQLFDKNPIFWDELVTNNSGNATSTHSTTNASTNMYVEATDTIVRQTKTHWNYQPGKSQLGLFTGNLTTASGLTGVIARIGLFTETDGLFFQSDSTTLSVTVRKASSNLNVERAYWNGDKMDGTGPSGVTIDATKCRIMFIDYEWLGVGRVRFGFFVDGIPVVCHTVNNFNQLTSVYISTPNLPVRYEISSAAGGSSATLQHICSSVISEGGIDDNGVIHTASTLGTHIDADAADVIYGVIGVRLKSTHLDLMAIPLALSMLCETVNDFYEWMLLMNPTVAGTPTWTAKTNSAMEVAKGATANTITAASWSVHMAGGFGTTSIPITLPLERALKWGSTIGGVSDQVWLCVRPLQANSNVQGTFTWREYV